jgi:hypothetical protein
MAQRGTLAHKARRKFNGHEDRYIAVNMENRRSIELRIFRGTLKPSSFFKSVEYVHALFSYSLVAGLNDLGDDSFVEWIGRHAKTYKYLQTYLTGHPTPALGPPRLTPEQQARLDRIEARNAWMEANRGRPDDRINGLNEFWNTMRREGEPYVDFEGHYQPAFDGRDAQVVDANRDRYPEEGDGLEGYPIHSQQVAEAATESEAF